LSPSPWATAPTSCLASSRRRTMVWPMRPVPMKPTFLACPPLGPHSWHSRAGEGAVHSINS
jgi:hypothetical protein